MSATGIEFSRTQLEDDFTQVRVDDGGVVFWNVQHVSEDVILDLCDEHCPVVCRPDELFSSFSAKHDVLKHARRGSHG